MATRSSIRFATRESGVSFNELPNAIHAKFYAHWDGYPSNRGVEIAESLIYGNKVEGWEVESLDTRHTDLEYVYYVWQAHGKETWISIFERTNYSEESWHLDYEEKDLYTCIFVGEPLNLIRKYKRNTNEEG
tara:strand:- start:374 stop:769 length:396 start_codon:yes stop_codon:yes gene_type:complete